MPARLGHLRLDVNDLDRQTAFYTEALGLTVRERTSDDESHYAFLTDDQPIPGGADDGMHHRLVLRQSRDASKQTLGETTRLDHFAWEVDDEAELLTFVERLRAMGVETDLQEAQIAWQCYVHDPEGVKLEVYCDRRARPDGAPLWKGRQEDLSEDRLREAAAR
ncbi:VOC family protein [Rubrivirga sp. S365]|uniref:VOC family protein n=1 Tax=Rubrivirga litoralis TaxID=3075598 RepID=A0ABU3BRD5_9BACT|nr:MULTISPECIES: VOC family protein [unclassified Rubrivirga]MDT0631843.1 VOC family protein [Rubrivirga sp. F394]MDT7856465.1 VOC family protein [Rubrivirga sp. S365]